MEQAEDFKAECAALYDLVAELSDAEFDQKTAFKGWTLTNDLSVAEVKWQVQYIISNPKDYMFNVKYEGNVLGQRVGNFVPYTDNGTVAKS